MARSVARALGLSAAAALALAGTGSGVDAGANAASATGTLAFVRSRESGTELWTVRGDGRALRRLTVNTKGGDEDPAWSPDGMKLAFARSLDGRRTIRIYVIRADGSGVRPVSPKRGTFAGAPSWSPDGRWIVFTGGGGLFGNCRGNAFVVHPDGTGFRRLARGNDHVVDPVWSPDGRRLAIVLVDERDRQWIFVGTAAGKQLRRLTLGGHPTWSPDGRRIAFVRMSRGVNRIFVIGTNRRGLRRLTRGNDFELSPAWSPDGTRIAYWSTAGGGQNVYTSRLSGGRPVRVTRAPENSGDQDPAWRP